MASKFNLLIIAILYLTVHLNHVKATQQHCSTDSVRDYAIDACLHISKRQTDLTDFGYKVEPLKGRNPHHRHHTSKKVTHPLFPRGGYLVVHTPRSRLPSYISNNIDENSPENDMNEISNDILTQDMKQTHHRHGDSIKNKYNMKFKRNADADPVIIDHCCLYPASCGKYFCH